MAKLDQARESTVARLVAMALTPDVFRQMVESLSQLIWMCRADDGACTYLSRQWLEYTGVPESEQLGYGWLKQIHPDDVERTQSEWTVCAESGEHLDIEFRIRRHDGEYRWFQTRAAPVLDKGGAIINWVGSNSDITHLKEVQERAERLNEELEASVEARNREIETVAAQLQTAQRITHVGSWELNIATSEVVWSSELFRVFGLSEESDAPGYHVQQGLFTEESWERLGKAIAHSVETGEGYELTLEVVRSDGERRMAVARAAVLLDSEGDVERLVGTFQDITDRENERAQLQTLSERLHMASQAAQVGVWDWDVPNNELIWDESMHRLYGTSPSDFPGAYECWESALHPEDKERVIAEITRALEDGTTFDPIFRINRMDGEERYIKASGEVFFNDQGTAARMVGVNWDVTEKHRADLRLQQQEKELRKLNTLLKARTDQAESANAAKSAFVANVSHDIRTPLGAILGVAYLLRRTPLSGDQDELLSTVEQSASTLLQMIDDILDISKMEASQLTLESAPFNVKELARELSGLMRGFALGKSIECHLAVDVDMPEQLVGDRVRIVQMLTNLAGNAIKFTDEGTVSVTLGATERETGIWFRGEVRDTGCGIDPDALEMAFEPFAQLSRVRSTGGTGLGLTIVRQLAAIMGGKVEAESVPGRGSRFWFEVPLGTSTEVVKDANYRPLQVLVIDGSSSDRDVLARESRALGWDVQCVSSGAEALEYLEGSPGLAVDAILLDCGLPEMDGVAVVEKLRNDFGAEGERWGVVMVTPRSGKEHAQNASLGLADAVLEKPADPGDLFDAVAEAVAKRNDSGERLSAALRDVKGVQRLRAIRVLVVDDSVVNREVARRVLELEGALVELACDGVEALQRLEAVDGDFDAVLMDVQMPRLDGIEAVRRIRTELGWDRLPVFALTAGAQAGDRVAALEAGMSEFVSKPFEPDQVVAAIRGGVVRAQGHLAPFQHKSPSHRRLRVWPALEGFDCAEARARFYDDPILFGTLLPKLKLEIDQMVEAIANEADDATLAASLHQVCGSCANLGAKRMSRLAKEADQHLSNVGRRDPEQLYDVTCEAETIRNSIKAAVENQSFAPNAAIVQPGEIARGS